MKKWLALLGILPWVTFAATPEKIVTLGGDVTEIVYALDAGSSLVARDSTSRWPQAATRLPDVGYLRQLNAEGILSVRPTLVLASAQAQPSLALRTGCAESRQGHHRARPEYAGRHRRKDPRRCRSYPP
ncbi:ABC transporter periplasmic protein [Enterobacter cancerogenus]|uniref:ABC transporter periplasmic protein n=1 Tax=Enterobacter cancerogenus TaxID=69218 RepID=A0A484Z8G8_9ENTR|nr:ABC transporter periplasmic protein [Enterobacter cancerogenus]